MISIARNNILHSIQRLTNQIYKLLPVREEGGDWTSPLNTIIIEIIGLKEYLPYCGDEIFELLCKLEGIKTLKDDKDFKLYRSVIFDCLKIMGEVSAKCKD